MDLATLQNVKDFMGISGGASDTKIELLIDLVSAYIEAYTNRTFGTTAYANEEYDGYGNVELRLKQYPVIAFTKLEHRKTNSNEDSWEEIDTKDYFVDLTNGIITKTTVFARGVKNYRATFTAGYATAPNDLKYCALVMISDMFSRSGNVAVKSESLGDHSITFETFVQENIVVKRILDKYRDIYV